MNERDKNGKERTRTTSDHPNDAFCDAAKGSGAPNNDEKAGGANPSGNETAHPDAKHGGANPSGSETTHPDAKHGGANPSGNETTHPDAKHGGTNPSSSETTHPDAKHGGANPSGTETTPADAKRPRFAFKRDANQSGAAAKERARVREILSVLRKRNIARGVSPDKLVDLLTDLGPTYVKIGQILSSRPDMLPAAYCAALSHLRSDVAPMPFPEVRSVVETALARPLKTAFASFSEKPLGSASIAQAHEARLPDGRRVVVKVQREGIYDTMSTDIVLLKRASALIEKIGVTGDVIDFDMVLSEMWAVAQEEMDFCQEAENAREFRRLNESVRYATCPEIIADHSSRKVLTMEYIDGFSLGERAKLAENGYDLAEIGAKLADNYVKQIIEDGFFHADPHQGNLRIRDGKIVWIDLGMMGRLTPRDQKLIRKGIDAVGRGDVTLLKEVVTTLGVVKGRPDQEKLYADLEDLLARYATKDFGSLNLSAALMDVLDVAKAHKISMPRGMSMLARGLATLEGVVADIAPEINVVEIALGRLSGALFEAIDWKAELQNGSRALYESSRKALGIPAQFSDALATALRGQMKLNAALNAAPEAQKLVLRCAHRLVEGVALAALILASALFAGTDAAPVWLGLPAPSLLCAAGAVGLGAHLLWRARKET